MIAFLLRIDPQLWADIERLAAAELRSVNAQVEYLLRDALRARGSSSQKTNPKATPKGSAPPSRREGLGRERS